MPLTVSALYRYPIKSMGEIKLQRAEIDRFGIKNDRRWMLVDENGQFLTQRQSVHMARFKMIQDVQGLQVSDGAPGASDTLHITTADFDQASATTVKVWRDECLAWEANTSINLWFSDRLKRACRLVYMPESTYRKVDPDFAKEGQTVSFADGFPLLLTTDASLNAFNHHLNRPIEMLRFRPNIVIAGAEPWDEDQWQSIKIGDLEFEVAKPCSRCAIPTINRNTLEKEPEVFKALRAHRSKNGEVFFGQNLIAKGEGRISVGDRVELL